MNNKWAFLGVKPHLGGTWTVFDNLRQGLLQQGIDLRWVIVGRIHASVLDDEKWVKECAWGEVIAPQEDNEFIMATELKEHLESKYKGAIVNVLCDRTCTNLMRYMPQAFKRIMLVHNISIGTYVAARSIRDYVHATIGVSYRITSDLIKKYNFEENRTFYIPNAIPIQRYQVARSVAKLDIRILFLSRIENQSKGCFRVPEVLKQLQKLNVGYHCTVVGDGPDLDEMKSRCAGLKVEFLGRVSSDEVPRVLAQHDVYLFPSVYEGFGLSLVEAMASGCVPVSSCIKGVTDHIINDHVSGFLVGQNDINAYVSRIQKLQENREVLNTMQISAKKSVEDQFTIEVVSKEFAEKIGKIENFHYSLKSHMLLNEKSWSYPKGLRPGLRTLLPTPLKNKLRQLREKLS